LNLYILLGNQDPVLTVVGARLCLIFSLYDSLVIIVYHYLYSILR